MADSFTASTPNASQRWWVIAEVELLDALRRVAAGEDPDVVMLEVQANSAGMKDDQ